MVVATELVSSVNPTHIAVVQLDAEWASDILNMAIPVAPCCDDQVALLLILGLSQLKLSWGKRYVLYHCMHLSSISVYL